MRLLSVAAALVLIVSAAHARQHPKVLFAVNAGGPQHTGSNGVEYQADDDEITIATPIGVSATVPIPISRAPQADQLLYQTERYALSSFGFDIPTPKESGIYTIILKFSEVYFRAKGAKVFDVELNSKHQVVESLDIFGEVGFAAAHDEFVTFEVKGNTLIYGDEVSTLLGTVRVEFLKTESDNPKINAIILVKGGREEAEAVAPLTMPVRKEAKEDDEEREEKEEAAATTGTDERIEKDDDSSTEELKRLEEERRQRRSQKRKIQQEETSLPLIEIFIGVIVIAVLVKFGSAFFSSDKDAKSKSN